MNAPPPIPRKPNVALRLIVIFGGVAVFLIVAIGFGIHEMHKFPGNFDNQFGDQHLKTAVALIELHKVRYGRYPASLPDLTFTGQWDQIALHNVSYYPNADGTAYYLEVDRGWIAKPTFTMPPEFWRGTGYSESLKPAAQ